MPTGKEDPYRSYTINQCRLIQLIQENIAPDAWDPPASVDAKQGTLVVRQSRDVHRQIRQLLIVGSEGRLIFDGLEHIRRRGGDSIDRLLGAR